MFCLLLYIILIFKPNNITIRPRQRPQKTDVTHDAQAIMMIGLQTVLTCIKRTDVVETGRDVFSYNIQLWKLGELQQCKAKLNFTGVIMLCLIMK